MALTLHAGVLPPTSAQEKPDPVCDLDHVSNEARDHRANVVVATSFGFGGRTRPS